MKFTLWHLKHLSSTDLKVLKPCQNVTVQTALSNNSVCMMEINYTFQVLQSVFDYSFGRS